MAVEAMPIETGNQAQVQAASARRKESKIASFAFNAGTVCGRTLGDARAAARWPLQNLLCAPIPEPLGVCFTLGFEGPLAFSPPSHAFG